METGASPVLFSPPWTAEHDDRGGLSYARRARRKVLLPEGPAAGPLHGFQRLPFL